MDQDFTQFQQIFFEESLELINNIEHTLVNLDFNKIDSETINAIFRCAHTIKSGSGMFGFSSIMEFTHMMENYLDMVRNEKRTLSPLSIDTLLKSVDCLRNMIYALQENKIPDTTLAKELEQKFVLLINENDHQDLTMAPLVDSQASNAPLNNHSVGWKIYFKPNLMIFQNGDDPIRIVRSLNELGKMQCSVDIAHLQEISEFHPDDCYLGWHIILETSKTEKEIRQFSFEWVEDDSVIIFKPLSSTELLPNEAIKSSLPSHNLGSTNKETMSIRVATEKVDGLVNLVGELIITQLMLTQICNTVNQADNPALKEGLLRLAHNCNELQDNVMRIRMLPISHLFNRFPRMVRDICKSSSKKIELKLNGESTELDKTVLEKISDPLVHLVRNALDHGIEKIEDRKKAGKPDIGILSLQAAHQGSNIVISISDDGKGLNEQKILAQAKTMKLVENDATLTTSQIRDLIFLPGFTTADKVTDISGRGVGLDVVRKNIEELGGHVSVESRAGEGTIFTISLPLTLAIMEGQLIRVGQSIFIMPLISMTETIQIKKQHIRTIGQNTEMYFLRGQTIPIIRLYELFQINVENIRLESQLLVIIEHERQFYGIMIDELLQLQQVVIKNMESNCGNIIGVAGATILGDGSVALILDTAGIIREFIQNHLPNPYQLAKAVG